MRLARMVLAFGVVLGACGEGKPPAGAKAPRTAREKARTEKVPPEERTSDQGKQWGGWRYQGRRDDCFFLVKRRCFDKRAEACAAAKCGKKECVVEGGGPASIRCE